ncbi:hypothetical protein HUJ05_009903 [Dendroctonus ponderosae]|nr:hypothetical protein HUJ05_009903 [Dendroctonus ponderosae]
MSDEEDLPKTLTPKESHEPIVNSQEPQKLPWGRILSFKKFLQNVDLVQEFTFGRAEKCTVRISSNCDPANVVFGISKIHFRIEKSQDDKLIYITDLSKNGTFVNKVKLGNGQRKILKSYDEIAVTSPEYKLYCFLEQSSQENDFLPPFLFTKYANIRLLGRGSCGEVRLVKNRDTLQNFAIKKIILSDSSLSHRINHPTKVYNEIDLLQKLKHPGVITMFDIQQHEREVYLVLEYMQGETLLKITDFGLSKLTEESNATTMCGTLTYVAPEVIDHSYRKGGEYGNSADIWSLGVILYFSITRELPFKGENKHKIAKNITTGNYDFTNKRWKDVEPTLVDLIKKMLEVVPNKRIDICDIFEHGWIKNDHCVKFRVRRMLRCEGLQNPMEEHEQPLKKFKFNDHISSSSNESNTTSANVGPSSSFPSSSISCT